MNVKGLFGKRFKRAHVVKCKSCEHQFWGKTKIRYSECPNCQAKCLIVNPSDISINERERMWRFLDDHEKETSAELDHDEFVEDGLDEMGMDYEGHWGNAPVICAYELSEEIRENLR